jgi:hypothetical protein
MTREEVVAALVAERYGPSLWWKTPVKTFAEEIAPVQRGMLLRAITLAEALVDEPVDNSLDRAGDDGQSVGGSAA